MYAIIENGIVVNVIVWDGTSEWSPPKGSSVEDITTLPNVGIGWTWDGRSFAEPAAPKSTT